jgi:hypothetical protein
MMRLLLGLALLEVMDKEPGIIAFWLSALVLGGAGFLLAHQRWWYALPILAILAVGFVATWTEWTDPYVGPAIASEAGASYPYHLIASTLLGAALTGAGMLWRRRAA